MVSIHFATFQIQTSDTPFTKNCVFLIIAYRFCDIAIPFVASQNGYKFLYHKYGFVISQIWFCDITNLIL